MTAKAIYEHDLRALDFRLLFWLLNHQTSPGVVDAPSGGWRAQALTELGTHRPHLWAAEKRLREAGVIVSAPRSRCVRINGSAFE